MPTRKLTIRLQEEEIDFAKQYAAHHGITVTKLIDRYLKNLQHIADTPLHLDIIRFSGIVPETVDARAEYHADIEEKHK